MNRDMSNADHRLSPDVFLGPVEKVFDIRQRFSWILGHILTERLDGLIPVRPGAEQ